MNNHNHNHIHHPYKQRPRLPIHNAPLLSSGHIHIQRGGHPLNVVVVGGTRGFGRALVSEFAKRGDNVIFTSRSRDNIVNTVKHVRDISGRLENDVIGLQCDVTSTECMRHLRSKIEHHFDDTDIWVNNAALSGGFKSFEDTSYEQAKEIIQTNLIGTMHASKCAMESNHGIRKCHVFNVTGAGSDGASTIGYAVYGATKAGILQFTKTLQSEYMNNDHLRFHVISPGMMITDLLTEGATPRLKGIFNIFAEEPEIVASNIMPQILSVVACDKKNQHVKYLTIPKILFRCIDFASRKSRFFDV
jgi:NAD(P)-dependent dehydrogenase (short-subunit alcohol dehydrogenase family)